MASLLASMLPILREEIVPRPSWGFFLAGAESGARKNNMRRLNFLSPLSAVEGIFARYFDNLQNSLGFSVKKTLLYIYFFAPVIDFWKKIELRSAEKAKSQPLGKGVINKEKIEKKEKSWQVGRRESFLFLIETENLPK